MALLWFNPWSSSPYKFYKAVIKLTNIIICKSSAEKLSSLRIYPVVDFLLIARLMYNNCSADSRQLSPHVKESNTVLDSVFCTVDSGIQGTGFQYLSAELGFWIPIVSGVPDFKTWDFRFHKQNFPRFRNPDSLTWSEQLGWYPNQSPQLPTKKFIWEYNLRRICSMMIFWWPGA